MLQKIAKLPNKTGVYSSEDEQPTTKVQGKHAVKRKPAPKQKNSNGNTGKTSETKPPPLGPAKSAKQPPHNVKTNNAGPVSKPTPKYQTGKAPPKSNNLIKGVVKGKEPPKVSKNRNATKLDLSKKKSIFSPENSSESENELNSKVNVSKSAQIKSVMAKPRPKATAKAIEKPKLQDPKKSDIKNVAKLKNVVSSGSSASTSSESNSSSSDSESSVASASSKRGNLFLQTVVLAISFVVNVVYYKTFVVTYNFIKICLLMLPIEVTKSHQNVIHNNFIKICL